MTIPVVTVPMFYSASAGFFKVACQRVLIFNGERPRRLKWARKFLIPPLIQYPLHIPSPDPDQNPLKILLSTSPC